MDEREYTPSAHDRLLIDTVARHFDGARVSGSEIDLGTASLSMRCWVNGTNELGAVRAASLYFELYGGRLGEKPIFASMSGYGESVDEAILGGGCNWACAMGKVLTVALAGDEPSDDELVFETVVAGQSFRGVVGGLDRILGTRSEGSGASPDTDHVAALRERLGGAPWLIHRILEAGAFPVLPAEHATVLSLFVADIGDRRVVEFKVNGAEWAAGARAFAAAPPPDTEGGIFLRELAVLVPEAPPVELARSVLAETFAGASLPMAGARRPLVDWPGWRAHDGRLGEPASEVEVAALERRVGPLPADYRAHLLHVQASGAGPGFGLLSPFHPEQERLCRGEFDWVEGEVPDSEPAGVLALAHAGCAIMWLLVMAGPHRGEVWVDARGSDERARRVASSFDHWYRAWLDGIVRAETLFTQWDGHCCASPQVFSKLIHSLEDEGRTTDEARRELPNRVNPRAVSVMAGESAYFDARDLVDACGWCHETAISLGLASDVFAPGIPPLQSRPPRKRGLWARLLH